MSIAFPVLNFCTYDIIIPRAQLHMWSVNWESILYIVHYNYEAGYCVYIHWNYRVVMGHDTSIRSLMNIILYC